MQLGYGWLAAQPELPSCVAGVVFDDSTPTRTEEYHLLGAVFDNVEGPRGAVCDAGCGFNPAIHVTPFILAHLGYWVEAVDLDLRQFALPWYATVRRTHANIGAMPFPDAAFDHLACISTLEHVSEIELRLFREEAGRLVRPGGLLLVTMDETEPSALARMFDNYFDVGSRAEDPKEQLNPRVAYLIAMRR